MRKLSPVHFKVHYRVAAAPKRKEKLDQPEKEKKHVNFKPGVEVIVNLKRRISSEFVQYNIQYLVVGICNIAICYIVSWSVL